nr:hypothetical protein [Streptomonospora salina]
MEAVLVRESNEEIGAAAGVGRFFASQVFLCSHTAEGGVARNYPGPADSAPASPSTKARG